MGKQMQHADSPDSTSGGSELGHQPASSINEELNSEIVRHNSLASSSRWLFSLLIILVLATGALLIYEQPAQYEDLSENIILQPLLAVSENGRNVALLQRQIQDSVHSSVLLSTDSGKTFRQGPVRLRSTTPPTVFTFDPENSFLLFASTEFGAQVNLDKMNLSSVIPSEFLEGMRGVTFVKPGLAALYGANGISVMNYDQQGVSFSELLPHVPVHSLECDRVTGKCKAIVDVALGKRRRILLEADSLPEFTVRYQDLFDDYFQAKAPKNRAKK